MSALLSRVFLVQRCVSKGLFVRKYLSTVSSDQLKVFPEFCAAVSHEQKGHLSKATPLFERVFDITASSIGTASPLTNHVGAKLANNLLQQGKFNNAVKILSSTQQTVANTIHYEQLLSLVELIGGNADKALELAVKVTEKCEAQCSTTTDITLFSNCYSVLGLAHLSLGNVFDAESYLQLSARWAQTPLEQLVALTNLGAASWYALDEESSSAGVVRHRERRFLQAVNTSKGGADSVKPVPVSVDEDIRVHRLMKEAVGYWEEALRDAAKGDAAANTSAAMCGPMGGGEEDTLGMTGLGNKALRVDASSASSVEVSRSSNTRIAPTALVDALSERLANVHFASAYANLLCNLAEASELTGDLSRRDEYVASALKTLDLHIEDARSHPALGRVLSRAAGAHLDASQAVTSEGLFRSALDRLKGPFAEHDIRYVYERAVALAGYGRLLLKWEKREEAGREMQRQARSLLESLPKGAEEGEKVYLSSLVQFPFGL